jgi:hypothetical protein
LGDGGSGDSGIVEPFGKRPQVWHVGSKNSGGLKGMHCGEIQGPRKEPAFACFVACDAGRPLQVAAPGKDDEQLKVFQIGA